jgi:hypothetical protein
MIDVARTIIFKTVYRFPILTMILALSFLVLVLSENTDGFFHKTINTTAVQTIYRKGVPHTDRNGRKLMTYDSERSFFQIGIWGNPYGKIYDYEYDLKVLTDVGANTMWPWPLRSVEDQLEAGRKAGLQVVIMGPIEEAEAAKLKDHPNWLANVWHDEPTGSFWGKDMAGKYKEFLAYKARINELAPGRAVFVNDVPWIRTPATQWWIKWNSSGDVSCHDNYPIMNRKYRARTIGNEQNKTGIPDSVSLAVAVNKEEKPVWFIVGAFLLRGHGSFPFRMPTPMQLRAQVYAAIIHGATGIIYFCWDTYVCRDGNVIGMSPDPQVTYLEPGPNRPNPSPAKPMQLVQSKALWTAAKQINSEIKTMEPSLLSPTVGKEVRYTVKTKGQHVTDTPIRCLLKPHPDGGYILLAVNLDDAVLLTTFEFPGGLKSVSPLFENRDPYTIKPSKTNFSDRFEPFDVHVYRITDDSHTGPDKPQ